MLSIKISGYPQHYLGKTEHYIASDTFCWFTLLFQIGGFRHDIYQSVSQSVSLSLRVWTTNNWRNLLVRGGGGGGGNLSRKGSQSSNSGYRLQLKATNVSPTQTEAFRISPILQAAKYPLTFIIYMVHLYATMVRCFCIVFLYISPSSQIDFLYFVF